MYTIKTLAQLAGISTRTLRYYDEIGLLIPAKKGENNYRYYSQKEVDLLHQIELYKEIELPLKDIKEMITSPHFNALNALYAHQKTLQEKYNHIAHLIDTVNRSIQSMKGMIPLTNEEKFEHLKATKIQENKKKYHTELCEKYGEETIEASYDKMKKMSQWQFNHANELEQSIKEDLKAAKATNNPTSSLAQELCKKHQEWIQLYWPKYNKSAHLSLCEMYVKDARFNAYYENIVSGGAQFLYDAMKHYLSL